MYAGSELIWLTRAYVAGTGRMASSLSGEIHGPGNTKLLPRLLDGFDILISTAEKTSVWFDLNWPAAVPWPIEVRARGTALAAAQPRGVPEPKQLIKRWRKGGEDGGATAGEDPPRGPVPGRLSDRRGDAR